MSLFWLGLSAFFGIRYGLIGYKEIEVQKGTKVCVVKDPFCDYLFTPDEKKYYRWNIRPIKIKAVD